MWVITTQLLRSQARRLLNHQERGQLCVFNGWPLWCHYARSDVVWPQHCRRVRLRARAVSSKPSAVRPRILLSHPLVFLPRLSSNQQPCRRTVSSGSPATSSRPFLMPSRPRRKAWLSSLTVSLRNRSWRMLAASCPPRSSTTPSGCISTVWRS